MKVYPETSIGYPTRLERNDWRLKMQRRIERIGLLLTPTEKAMLRQLADTEGLSEAATVRQLLYQAEKDAGQAIQQLERPLADWERRLLEKVRHLQNGGKPAMIMVKFDGRHVTFWRVLPDGRVE